MSSVVSWRCVRCGWTENAAPGDEPIPVGCDGDTQTHHEWVQDAAFQVACQIERLLPGHTVTVFREGGRRGTLLRVDAPDGSPLGVAMVSDDAVRSLTLQAIVAQAPQVVTTLAQMRASNRAETHFVLLGERGILVKLR